MNIAFEAFSWLRRSAAIALLCAVGVASAMQVEAVVDDDDDVAGALVGELMFRVDLLHALDTLCPRGGTAKDWQAALPPLPAGATTAELLALSRRLGADAGQQLVRDNGGCTTGAFASAYDESRQTLGELIERWRRQ